MDPALLELCLCPKCGGAVEEAGEGIRCASCRTTFPTVQGIPVLAADPCRVVDAVIDKDRAACLIARQLGAQALLLVTAVDRVMLDYGTPTQSSLGTITADLAARYLAEGQFPPGSMGPKIEAALRFLDQGGELAVITSPELLAATLAGHGEAAGTRIERAASQNGQAR